MNENKEEHKEKCGDFFQQVSYGSTAFITDEWLKKQMDKFFENNDELMRKLKDI